MTEPRKKNNRFAADGPTIRETRCNDGGREPGESGGAKNIL